MPASATPIPTSETSWIGTIENPVITSKPSRMKRRSE
jgi:hypothetical protein